MPPIIKKLSLALPPIIYLFLTKTAFAIDTGLETTGKQAFGQLPETSLPKFIGNIISSLLALVGIVFFILMVYGGFIWMKARGNEKEVEKAKNIITDSIIGVIIVAAAYALTNFVVQILSK